MFRFCSRIRAVDGQAIETASWSAESSELFGGAAGPVALPLDLTSLRLGILRLSLGALSGLLLLILVGARLGGEAELTRGLTLALGMALSALVLSFVALGLESKERAALRRLLGRSGELNLPPDELPAELVAQALAEMGRRGWRRVVDSEAIMRMSVSERPRAARRMLYEAAAEGQDISWLGARLVGICDPQAPRWPTETRRPSSGTGTMGGGRIPEGDETFGYD